MPAAYDAEDLQRRFAAVSERMSAIEAQLAALSEKAGVPYEAPADQVPAEVTEMLSQGDTRGAMKRYRELTGAGADDARKALGL